jgi:YbgC/YbaW family acyl-CoA thioester hydrolase
MEAPATFHFTHSRRVEFADTDMAGIVHFANFFRFVESAEHAWFRSLGHPVHTSSGAVQLGWPRLETACRFHRPARFEQTLDIGLRIQELRTSSLTYSFSIIAADDPARPLLAEGSFAIVHVEIDPASHTLRKAPIPPELREKLQRLVRPAS